MGAGHNRLFSLKCQALEMSTRQVAPFVIATLRLGLLTPILIVLTLFAADVRAADDAEAAIRTALAKWTEDFNASREHAVCDLFAPDLLYDFRGYPERDYSDICERLRGSLRDESKQYAYSLDIREVLVAGDVAVVRLVWTLVVTLGDGQEVTSVEPGMDVFRREPDGTWKIIRYMAYEVPLADSNQNE